MNFSTMARAVRAAASPLALAGILVSSPTTEAPAQQSLPAGFATPGAVAVMTVHAVGAQIYECVADAPGKPGWRFREPIATLIVDGSTVGRHFAGPSWALSDGSLIVGKVVDHAPGATAEDIPWLKLEAAPGLGVGRFAAVTVIERINTKGGALGGPCDTVGKLTAVPYASDYVFLKRDG